MTEPSVASAAAANEEKSGPMLHAGNYEVLKYPGLIIKHGYWRWPERSLAGNAIDLCMNVLNLSFHDAMREITRS